jgi:hypothetical protein
MGAPATSARRLHGGLEGAVPTRRGSHPNAGILLGGRRAASTSVSPHEGASPSVTTPDPPNTITIKVPVTVNTVATVP